MIFLARVILAFTMVVLNSRNVAAQTEDVEPRSVGGAGVMSLGISGFVDKLMSSEDTFPFQATVQVDVTRFLTTRIAIRGGLIGSGSFGGDDSDDLPTGPGQPALHALVGGFFYFTPESMMTFYSGGEYRAQLTRRADRDAGTLLGKAGLQAALSSRTSIFVEGGYGARLTRGDEDELQTRIVGEVGIRIKF
jgi:hypothetical protein